MESQIVHTTSDSLFKGALETEVSNYKKRYLQILESYPVPKELPQTGAALIATKKQLETALGVLQEVVISTLRFDALDYVDKVFKDKYSNYTQRLEILQSERANNIERASQTHAREELSVKQHNEDIISPLREKKEELQDYQTILEDVFDFYGITPVDIHLSGDLTQQEYTAMMDAAIEVCRKYAQNTNNLFDLIAKPVEGSKDLSYVVMYTVSLLAITYFALPLLALPVGYYLAKSVSSMIKDIDKLKLARHLMTKVDYMEYVDKSSLQEVQELDTSSIEEDFSQKKNQLVDPTTEHNQILDEVQKQLPKIEEICAEAYAEVKAAYAEHIDAVKAQLAAINKMLEQVAKTKKVFPTQQNLAYTMNRSFVLSRVAGAIDVNTQIPPKNIVFDSSDRLYAIDMIKLYLCNALLSVRPYNLNVLIYDPLNQGSDFAEFYTTDLDGAVQTAEDKELRKVMDEVRKYSQDNIKELRHETIDAFNTIADKEDMIPKKYKIIIVLSKVEEFTKEAVYMEYFRYSVDSGVMLWILDSRKWADGLWVTKIQAPEDTELIMYDDELGQTTIQTYAQALKTAKPRAVIYEEKFQPRYIPREKWWTYNTIEGIDLRFGLQDSDPGKGYVTTLGDRNVHMLCAGATGSGKSAFLNQMMCSLFTMYPPSELQILFIDFKNMEAAKFAENGFSTVPHFKVLSGTTDGEYALSVFEYLITELGRRQSEMGKANFNNITDYRKAHPEVKMPRILVIFDEFQAMFNTEYVPQKIINTIIGKIDAFTKLARASGGHLCFTSQSMKGTLSADTLANFSLRCALFCKADVSNTIIGNPAASKLPAKIGYIMTNDSMGENPAANKLWRVPFLNVPVFHDIIKELNTMCTDDNPHAHAIFYDDKERHSSTKLDAWYAQYPQVFAPANILLLGERASFSTNKAPTHLKLLPGLNENICLSAFEKEDFLNLIRTIAQNAVLSDAIVVMNIQDKDSYQLLEVDKYVSEQLRDFADPAYDVPTFIDTLQAMIKRRQTEEGPHKTMYVFCVEWERVNGIGCSANYKLQEQFTSILREGPTVGVHFIIAMQSKLEVPRTIPQSCKHRICGLQTANPEFFIDCESVAKLPPMSDQNGRFAIYSYGTNVEKFNIYQFKCDVTLESRSVVLE